MSTNRAKKLIEDIGGIWSGHGVNKHRIFRVFPMSYFWSNANIDDEDNMGDGGDFEGGDAGGGE